MSDDLFVLEMTIRQRDGARRTVALNITRAEATRVMRGMARGLGYMPVPAWLFWAMTITLALNGATWLVRLVAGLLA